MFVRTLTVGVGVAFAMSGGAYAGAVNPLHDQGRVLPGSAYTHSALGDQGVKGGMRLTVMPLPPFMTSSDKNLGIKTADTESAGEAMSLPNFILPAEGSSGHYEGAAYRSSQFQKLGKDPGLDDGIGEMISSSLNHPSSTVPADVDERDECRGEEGISCSVSNDVVDPQAVPMPNAAWLFMSGLLGLVGIARRDVSVTDLSRKSLDNTVVVVDPPRHGL